MGFGSRLTSAVLTKKNPVCVGLDPRWQQLPGVLRVDPRARGWQATADAYRTFCYSIIDVVAPLVPIVKPQSAFFEELGPSGVSVLEQVVRYATSKGLLVILDGKRNDIGSTATAYAKAYLGTDSPFGADSLTVSPFLGKDSLDPFVDRCIEADAGIFVLVKTSNPGSGFMQDLSLDGATISDRVADYVQEQAMKTADSPNGYGSVGCVVGATYPEQLIAMRQRMPNAWILIPGYGAQGGSAEDVRHGLDSRGLGAVVNSSRGIIFAHEKPQYASVGDWTQAVEAATREMIEQLR
ncbi:orotidine 5'-phosphate decarboxylase [Pirellula sp. SH-Sr6A]|uniref:orotidine-5'-phosphate decarboxylase n=1 Tax=Pirellula sp. SH-Sr6A TaxID=1632865 RepID=UPI00078B4830|nr:orotidine-5'-phosphate decarboxylase [Pirellula sp. SH-Sr6A]AMV30776.1 orotidine 5'-phosphate decarboxylase [Pirellula sp. SH-Sr6A]